VVTNSEDEGAYIIQEIYFFFAVIVALILLVFCGLVKHLSAVPNSLVGKITI
jgi:hypothetical protein